MIEPSPDSTEFSENGVPINERNPGRDVSVFRSAQP